MARCFAGITNIGTDHWSPLYPNVAAPPVDGDTQEETSNFGPTDNVFNAFSVDGQDEENIISPSPASGKRLAKPMKGKGKEKKHKTENAILIQEAVTSMASSANEYVLKREGKISIDQVMELVIACGANFGSNEHYIASELFVKKEQREMFMTLPTDEIRFNWLRRKYNDKFKN